MLDAYCGLAPDGVLDELRILAGALKGRALQHINATRTGGGVTELLARLTPWTESLGITTRWDVIAADPSFFEVTKTFHGRLRRNSGSQRSGSGWYVVMMISLCSDSTGAHTI